MPKYNKLAETTMHNYLAVINVKCTIGQIYLSIILFTKFKTIIKIPKTIIIISELTSCFSFINILLNILLNILS